jgi:tRNA(Arg) A34 adenosine deaminase TadA
MNIPPVPDWLPVSDPLAEFWREPVALLADAPRNGYPTLDPELAARHTLYGMLVMALVRQFWNGNRFGPIGDYPQRARQKLADLPNAKNAVYQAGDAPNTVAAYLGHNIAAVAVDGQGNVIDFEFNHNEVFRSSAEHAESRLVRRLFALAQIYDDWYTTSQPKPNYGKILSEVTIYTSLESCAQCSGVMALANVRQVVFLQRDPGTYSIGTILYNLTHDAAGRELTTKIPSPYPLPGSVFRFPYWDTLERGYQAFAHSTEPFYLLDGKATGSATSRPMTSFLCTDTAFAAFDDARTTLEGQLEQGPLAPDYTPKLLDSQGNPVPNVLSNAGVWSNVKKFWAYAQTCGSRATPHGR